MWTFIAILVVSILFAVFMPTPEQTTPEPGKMDVTTADEGNPIPVVFGTRDVYSQNVTWFGDTKSVAIRKKSGKK